MARPKGSGAVTYSPSQAVYILERAMADRKLSTADIRGYQEAMQAEISHLEERLSRLRSSVTETVKHVVQKIETKVFGNDLPFPKSEKKIRKRKKRISAERQASMQLQGQYLGLLAKTPQTQRAKFKKISKTEGRDAAMAAMRKELQ